jgi:soluble lytic murein transglycosylase
MDHDSSITSSTPVRALRMALLATVALGIGVAAAQTPTAQEQLPSGLTRQGNVVMMAPIGDSGDATAPLPSSGDEKREGLVHVLSPADHDLYGRAFEAANRGDWIAARGLADQGHDPIARLIIQWRYLLDKNSGASFAEISTFLKNYADWPNNDTLTARAEHAIDPTMEPHAVIAWFGDRAPVSNMGKIRLGEALVATGSVTRGNDLIRQGWIGGSFDPNEEFAIIQRDGAILTPEVDRQRLAHLIANNDSAGVRREMPRVSSETQRVATAAMEFRTSPSAGERMVADLPQPSQDDPILLLDRTHLLRQNVHEIPQLLVSSPTREMAKIAPTRWWDELNLDARTALQSNDYTSAYGIAAHTGLTSDTGTNYSEAEFLAGWIALRFLKDPQTALIHFKNISQSVSRPISRARSFYWTGRAYEALGDNASAWQQYKLAGQLPQFFYGQLALARISADPQLNLKNEIVDGSPLRADYEHEALTRAIRVLADLGEDNFLRDFAVHDVDVYPDRRHIKLLAEDLTRMGFKDVAVRVAKEASYQNVWLLSYSHPVISIPAYSGPGTAPESALVLGVIRQETEFNPASVSYAGARGIIQVMPSSVRHLAGLAGLPYRPNDMTRDQDYALKIGMTELAQDLSEWSGSYILAAAAYNAGPGNVRRWISQFGDPRDARVDPVDWIEQIPFEQTRNYVQRVLENTEVYRNRLAGHDQKLQILADLYRPDAPQAKVLSYAPSAQGSDSGIPVPVPRPSDSVLTTGTVTGGQAVIPASAPQTPDTPSSAGETPTPKPRPER